MIFDLSPWVAIAGAYLIGLASGLAALIFAINPPDPSPPPPARRNP